MDYKIYNIFTLGHLFDWCANTQKNPDKHQNKTVQPFPDETSLIFKCVWPGYYWESDKWVPAIYPTFPSTLSSKLHVFPLHPTQLNLFSSKPAQTSLSSHHCLPTVYNEHPCNVTFTIQPAYPTLFASRIPYTIYLPLSAVHTHDLNHVNAKTELTPWHFPQCRPLMWLLVLILVWTSQRIYHVPAPAPHHDPQPLILALILNQMSPQLHFLLFAAYQTLTLPDIPTPPLPQQARPGSGFR